jgi:long-chain acyl-CoA synthetase
MTQSHTGLADNPATSTLPKLLERNAASLGRLPGIREKDFGIWKTYSWHEYRGNVRDFALGLAALGFGRDDKLSVVGDNCPRLYWAQLAAQALGGIAVPVYQDAIATELVYVLNHAEVSVVVAEDQEQVDKILSLKGDLPHLRTIIYDDPRGLGSYDDAMLQSVTATRTAGRAFGDSNLDYFARELAKGNADDVVDRLHIGQHGPSKGRAAQPPQSDCDLGNLLQGGDGARG